MSKKTTLKPDGHGGYTMERSGGCLSSFGLVLVVLFLIGSVVANPLWLLIVVPLAALGIYAWVLESNSKKERIAKSLERQEHAGRRTAGQIPVEHVNALDELTKANALHDQGVLPDEQFEAIKTRLLAQIAAEQQSAAMIQARSEERAAKMQERRSRKRSVGGYQVTGSGLGAMIETPRGRRKREQREAVED